MLVLGQLAISLVLSIGAANADKAKVVLACYPSDESIAESCGNFEKKMQSCGFEVVRLNDAGPKALAEAVAKLPDSVPLFVSAHGVSLRQKHYVESKSGNVALNKLGPHDPWRVSETERRTDLDTQLLEKGYLTADLVSAVGDRLTVLSACFSGRACENLPHANLVAACGSEEAADSQSFAKDGEQEPVLQMMAELFCDPQALAAADQLDPVSGKADGLLSQGEVANYLAKRLGGKKQLEVVFSPVGLAEGRAKGARQTIAADARERKKLAAIWLKQKQAQGSSQSRFEVVQLGDAYEGKFEIAGKVQHIELPDTYVSPRGAELAAQDFAKEKNGKWLGSVKAIGEVLAGQREDLTQPCLTGRDRLPQTPTIGAKVRIPGSTKTRVAGEPPAAH